MYRLGIWFLFLWAALAKSPLTHETMWLMKRVGAPVVSPNGKWVVFAVTEPAYDAKDQVSDLWIVPADGSAAPRRLTATKSAESGIDWSADSARIVFTARRDGDESSQVYLLDIAGGGEARRITSLEGGASSPKFHPDGKSILYQGIHDPLAGERKVRKYNARVYDSFPIRMWDHWLDEKRPRLYVQSLEEGSTPKDLFSGTKLIAEPGFHGVLGNSGSDLHAIWAPDGGSIVFVATTNSNSAAYAPVLTQLYQIPASGGEPRRISSGQDEYSTPLFRPDGKALYGLQARSGDRVYSLSRLVMFAWPDTSAPPRIVSQNVDRSIDGYTFSPDSQTLFFTAEEHGLAKLFSLPASGGAAKIETPQSQGEYLNLSGALRSHEPVLVANWDSAVNPPEAVRIDLRDQRHSNLTRFNFDKAAEIDWQPVRHFWFTSRRGRRVHNILTLPPAFDSNKKYPLVVFIHGGPHAMSRDQFHTRWNYHLLASPGYAVLTTNYTGSTGFGEQFAQNIQGDPLKTPGEEIEQAVDEALKQFPFLDGTRMAAGGASYGGHMANWLQASTTRYKCLYSHAGLINLESQWGTSDTIYHREINNGGPVWEQGRVWREQNPIRFAARFKTPILLTVGEQDFRVPLNQTLENWSVLQRLRIPSRLVVFPDENHWILKGENNRYFYRELHGWLGKWLN
jgi:dipeptidyl aminopeptidase/acylaminoacyl peptidase